MNRIVVGCGYLGLPTALQWRDDGDCVHVVTRSEKRALELANAGLKPLVADVTRAETLGELPATDTVLFAVGFDRTSGNSIGDVYVCGLKNVLAALPANAGHLIYVSTTGVYGSAGGDWVDEMTPPHPQREGGKASLAAEQVLTQHPLGKRSAILRLAGIYGPGRIPYLDKLKQGEPIAAPSDGWLNLIHVDDAAAAVVATAEWLRQARTDGPHLFCVSDGQPVVRANYYREAARLIGAPPPRFTAPEPGSPAALRAGANRRVANDKLLRDLGVKLAYPSHREGLASILANACKQDA